MKAQTSPRWPWEITLSGSTDEEEERGGVHFLSTGGRTAISEAKLQAYYTDPDHCRRISRQLRFEHEDGKKFFAFEPSIGNAIAILTALNVKNNHDVAVYGCDIMSEVVEENKKNPLIAEVISGTFPDDFKISNGSFNVVFSNPPYGERADEIKGRLETTFLQKIISVLADNGLLIWVVPVALFGKDNAHNVSLARNFVIEKVFRFDDSEFAKWHQVCVFARRRNSAEVTLKPDNGDKSLFERQYDFIKTLADFDIVKILPTLPEDVPESEKLSVYPSNEESVRTFRMKEINTDIFYANLFEQEEKSPLAKKGVIIEGHDTDKVYEVPKIPPAETLSLCIAGGLTSGLAGDENHLHLMRGSTVDFSTVETRAVEKDGEKYTETITHKTHSVRICVIESDGKISWPDGGSLVEVSDEDDEEDD